MLALKACNPDGVGIRSSTQLAAHTLAAFLIMLPRLLFLSPSPADALTETVAVTLVGGLTIWLA